MNKVNVLFFASLRERAGLKQTTLELQQGASVKDLKGALKEKYPSLTPALEASLVSVNREYAFDEDTIPEGAEVALFPPVSGGARAVQFPTILAVCGRYRYSATHRTSKPRNANSADSLQCSSS